ncbi:MAG: phosphoenolpyruvate--protein phosphotransferase [Candidatus Omnitrophica bacterium]|nr:phosphoenolpyruvate--protein phosphotransferase [Candidatus Omnitrophota bacterium]
MRALPTASSLNHLVLRGLPIVCGYATGQLVFSRNALLHEYKQKILTEDEVEDELKRIQLAIDKVCGDLTKLKSKVASQIDTKHAEIFESHFLILTDIELFKDIEKDLRGRLLNAEKVVQDVFLRWEKKLRASRSSDISERADDIQDLGRRLLEMLSGVVRREIEVDLPADSVLFAQRLLPSDVVSLDIGKVKAIITEEGTQNSHSSILARALDIPLVSKINFDNILLIPGAKVIVDGKNGQVIINPKEREWEAYTRLIRKKIEYKVNLMQRVKDVPLTMDKRIIKVMANVSSLNDLKMAKKFGADGIGLYRTEVFYLAEKKFPTEEDFYNHLKITLGHLSADTITLRLLDISGDKKLPFWGVVEDANPALGLNGIRLLLKYPRLLEMQLRVFLRLSAEFNVQALVPMVSLSKDMIETRNYLQKEKEKLRHEGLPFNENLALGAMVETPAAILSINELIELSDFISIGTNDLVQYVMAAGRGRDDVADYYEAGNYLILDMLKEVIRKSKVYGKECLMCGELAGDLNFTKDLLKIGLRNFSVQAPRIPYVKDHILSLLRSEEDQSNVKGIDITIKPRFHHSNNLDYFHKESSGVIGVSKRK